MENQSSSKENSQQFNWEEAYKAMLDIVYPNRTQTLFDLTLLEPDQKDS